MEEFTKILTALLGSNRSGIDILFLLLGLAIAFLIVTCRKDLVAALISLIISRVKIAEQRATACTLQAAALTGIQGQGAAILEAVNANHDRIVELGAEVARVSGNAPEEAHP